MNNPLTAASTELGIEQRGPVLWLTLCGVLLVAGILEVVIVVGIIKVVLLVT